MNLRTSSIRYLLYGINFLFVITGIIIISVGISIKLYYRHYMPFIQDQYVYVPNFLIIIGISIFAIAVLGWCGAVNENSFVTLMFATFLLLIFFLEISVGISGYLLKSTTENSLKQYMKLPSAESNHAQDLHAWNRLQEDFNCCGIDGPNDWNTISNVTTLPHSCCIKTELRGTRINKRRTDNCNENSQHLHSRGCKRIFENFLIDSSFTIEMVGFTLAIFQLVGIAISCQLSSEFRRGYHAV